MNDYVLHYAPDNASLIVRLALEELRQPYTARLVDRAALQQTSRGYRALNPAGLIPVLETAHGPIFETGAIVLWLADTHCALAPPPDDPGRGAFLKWLFFTSNTLHAGLRMTFYLEKYTGPDPEAQAALRHRMQATLQDQLLIIDQYRVATPEAPTVTDYYLAALLRWCALYPQGQTGWFDLARYPSLHAMAKMLEARPATRVAQIAEGLGSTPFTAPRLATPPEGSAT